MEPCRHALEGQPRTRLMDRTQYTRSFRLGLSDAPEALLSTTKELSVCVCTYAYVCVSACDGWLGCTWEGEEYALLSSSSTKNNLSSWIWFSFAFLLGFLGLWSQSSRAQQSPWHWAEWLGQLVHCTQYSSVLNCIISLRYLNPQLRTALAVLLPLLFTSLFLKLYQGTWGFTHSAPAPWALGSPPPALPIALASTKETKNGENPDFILVFFFFPLFLLFSGSSPGWVANCLEQL